MSVFLRKAHRVLTRYIVTHVSVLTRQLNSYYRRSAGGRGTVNPLVINTLENAALAERSAKPSSTTPRRLTATKVYIYKQPVDPGTDPNRDQMHHLVGYVSFRRKIWELDALKSRHMGP